MMMIPVKMVLDICTILDNLLGKYSFKIVICHLKQRHNTKRTSIKELQRVAALEEFNSFHINKNPAARSGLKRVTN